jgi:hypothetical protein
MSRNLKLFPTQVVIGEDPQNLAVLLHKFHRQCPIHSASIRGHYSGRDKEN